jgi:hypothetical protein
LSYTVSLTAASGGEATRIIPWSQIAAAGLAGNVSAVRLTCGTRPSRVSLFDSIGASTRLERRWTAIRTRA